MLHEHRCRPMCVFVDTYAKHPLSPEGMHDPTLTLQRSRLSMYVDAVNVHNSQLYDIVQLRTKYTEIGLFNLSSVGNRKKKSYVNTGAGSSKISWCIFGDQESY